MSKKNDTGNQPETLPEEQADAITNAEAAPLDSTVDVSTTEIVEAIENSVEASNRESVVSNTMIDEKTTTAEPSDQPEASQGKEPVSEKSSSSNRNFSFLKVFFPLFVFAVIGGAGYYIWPSLSQYPERFNTIEKNSNTNQERLAAAEQQWQQTSQKLQQQLQQLSENYQQDISSLQVENENLQDVLQEQQQQIRVITATTSEDWKLAEAYYLTRMATQRLTMERSAGGALALLQAADNIVRSQADPQLHDVRNQLAADMLALKLFADIDRQGVFLELAALEKQLQSLPVAQLPSFGDTNSKSKTENSAAKAEIIGSENDAFFSRIKNSFFSNLEKMNGFIRVNHYDEELSAPIALEQKQWALFQLQSSLQNAQLGLLRDEQQIYQNSLQTAQVILSENFSDLDIMPNILEALESLEVVQFSKELPDISESERVLGEYLDRLHRIGDGVSSSESEIPSSENISAQAGPLPAEPEIENSNHNDQEKAL